MKLKVLVVTLPLIGGGCTGMAAAIDAAAKDQNPVCIDMSGYGTSLHYNRLHGCDRP